MSLSSFFVEKSPEKSGLMAEGVGFEPTWGLSPKRFSRPPRYDRFDNPPWIARRGLRSGSASAESAAWFIGEADITLRVCYLIVFFSPLEFSIEIILGEYFTVSKTACFEPLSEVAVLHHRAAVRHFKTASL